MSELIRLAFEDASTQKVQAINAHFHWKPLHSQATSGIPTWHVTARRHIAEQIAGLLGGQPGQSSSTAFVEVETETTELAISVPRPEAIQVRWHAGNSLGSCGAGEEFGFCRCPSNLADRRRAARLGRGCEPHAQVWFRLSGAPLLGLCDFSSGSWSFAEDLIAAYSLLRGHYGLVDAKLSLDQVFGTLSTGQAVVFSRPRLTLGRDRIPH